MEKIENFFVGSSNVIKNITNEILRECAKINVNIEENVITYIVNLLSLDPKFQFLTNFDRSALERFVSTCVQKLSNESHPSLKTLTMQSYFMRNRIDNEIIINKQRELIKNKIGKLTKEITETNITTKEEKDKLFKKIVVDIIINNGFGNPMNKKIFSETSQALNSVMSKTDITGFLVLNRQERMKSLKDDIRDIVCGVRVFNKDAGHCDEGIIDLIQIVTQSCDSTKSILDITLIELLDRINLLTSAIFSTISFNIKTNEIDVTLSNDITSDNLELLKDMLVMSRQQELYVRILMENLVAIKHEVDSLIEMFRKILDEIHESVQYKTAVQTDQVFPQFKKLGQIWNQLQNQIFVLSQINVVNNYMIQLADSLSYEDLSYKILKNNPVETDDERMGSIRMSSDCVENQKIELLGFCLCMCAKGILIPGNTKYGIHTWKNKNYTFCLKEAAITFEQNVEKYLQEIIEMARQKPEIIVFLDIFEEVKESRDNFGKIKTKSVTVVTQNESVQTELHPTPQNINKNYVWNIWELRRQAVLLANLKRCETHSTQTTMTYQKYEIKTQTYEHKPQSTQTKEDNSTNVENVL